MNIKNIAAGIGKDYIDAIQPHKMKVKMKEEVGTVEELINCLKDFKTKDGSDNYLMGKEQNGFTVELVEHTDCGSIVQDIRLTEKE